MFYQRKEHKNNYSAPENRQVLCDLCAYTPWI